MADYTQNPQEGFAGHQHPEYAVSSRGSLGKLTNLMGAAVSLVLVVGVGVWGYKLLVRDVTGIPVVRAAQGEMRARPEDPGGQLAQHQGLSVNTVAAIGSSEALAEELRLAPQPTDLDDEDQPMPEIEDAAAAPAVTPQSTQPDEQDFAEALESGSVDSIVAQLTNGVAPLEPMEDESVPVLASVDTQDMADMFDGDGMRISLRPTVRPKRAVATAASAAVAPVVGAASTTSLDLDAASLPAGTRLVQLGAFDTPEIARAQWGKLNARFAPFMEGKQRIVMEAKSGGRTFYRLRAHGFEDIGDARRFCSALVAESVDCIPVVTR
ncbi:SPOR domain-containing protein [Sulfitobacter sp. F26169L]|uniref:SPOR domain-containing protein n=1 Tax=Sulfitobacter sp. F26169L TaxID=2996015 RepID=UPI002260D9A8|nr:SPOR domain-containing protein [Sulfitobacter sp. F26169L]MCX7566106.1 SPOR domain-containing protein [Sulfitobacter sp. F26169L]